MGMLSPVNVLDALLGWPIRTVEGVAWLMLFSWFLAPGKQSTRWGERCGVRILCQRLPSVKPYQVSWYAGRTCIAPPTLGFHSTTGETTEQRSGICVQTQRHHQKLFKKNVARPLIEKCVLVRCHIIDLNNAAEACKQQNIIPVVYVNNTNHGLLDPSTLPP